MPPYLRDFDSKWYYSALIWGSVVFLNFICFRLHLGIWKELFISDDALSIRTRIWTHGMFKIEPCNLILSFIFCMYFEKMLK